MLCGPTQRETVDRRSDYPTNPAASMRIFYDQIMHTSEKAKDLWCPMARVAQVGAIETNVSYNRVYAKSHVPVKLMDPNQELIPGEGAKTFMATVLKTDVQLSAASLCLGSKCAVWRGADEYGHCGLAPIHRVSS